MCLAWLLWAAEESQGDARAPGRLAGRAYPSPEQLGAVFVVLAWQRRVREEVAAAAVVDDVG